MYRPKEVTERLGVSSATLRRWSDQFADYLSPSAGRSVNETGGATQRRYTDQDAQVLAAVKRLLDDGNTYEEVARKLPESVMGDVVADHDNTAKSLTKPIESGSLIAYDAYQQTIESLQQTIRYQDELITELRNRPRTVILPAMTLRQRLDWLLRGRMIGDNRNGAEPIPEESTQRLLPYHEPA
jgi:DNA-binding transcriptional MerR regulator